MGANGKLADGGAGGKGHGVGYRGGPYSNGAGGGGGYYGGGGGGSAAWNCDGPCSPAGTGAGEGGGSSYVESSATKVHLWRGWKKATTNGLVVFSWRGRYSTGCVTTARLRDRNVIVTLRLCLNIGKQRLLRGTFSRRSSIRYLIISEAYFLHASTGSIPCVETIRSDWARFAPANRQSVRCQSAGSIEYTTMTCSVSPIR
jgi:hypothetical protein